MSVNQTSRLLQPHWVVNLNRRIRILSFLAAFLILVSHVLFLGLSPWLYPALAVTFLLWPQLAYLRARNSISSMHAEFNNLIIDSTIFGLWVAWLGFPVWITFVLVISTAMNLMVFRGPRGLAQAMAGLVAGALAAGFWAGFRFLPQTHWFTTALAIVSISSYLLLVGFIAFRRNRVLHRAREQQQLAEQELKQQIKENRLLQEQLQEQANRDPLTGLYNRRYLDDSLHREMARCLRQGEPLSLVLIDLDHFKEVNDEHGHSAGDRVINQLAKILTTLSRASDIVCRFGGEEFLVVLPGTDLEAAVARAEEYRVTFEKKTVRIEGTSLAVTLSAGVACTYREIMPHDLIRQADQALYRAKESGRNRVVSQAPSTDQPQKG